MRFTSLSTLALSASLASARIVGISVPSTLAPNTTVPFTLITEGYIQSVADIAFAFGFQLPTAKYPTGYPGTLGSFLTSAYLGPQNSNKSNNVTIQVTVPDQLESAAWYGKQVVLTAGVYSVYGASGGPEIDGWNVTVTIGETTGGDNVASTARGWSMNTPTLY